MRNRAMDSNSLAAESAGLAWSLRSETELAEPDPDSLGRASIMIHEEHEVVPRRSQSAVRRSDTVDSSGRQPGDHANHSPLVVIKAMSDSASPHQQDLVDSAGHWSLNCERGAMHERGGSGGDGWTRLKKVRR